MFDAWDDDDVTGGYCSNNRRAEGEICRQRPEINPDNIKVNEESSLVVRGSDSVQLDFMVTADPNQLPIISYNVLWGDGNMTAVSGSRLRDRPNADNPFTSYHVYDHWEMQRYCEAVAGVGVCDTSTDCAQFAAAGSNVILCCPDGSNYCKTKVRIKIRDNWNAETCVYSDPDICNSEPSGLDDLQLNKYIPMSGTITVQQ